MQKSNERLQFIDLLRSLSIMCVVLCHAVESIYSLNLDFISSISLKSSVFAFSAFTIGRLGVPVFLMMTGYLLLDRDYDDKACKKFWKKNLLHLFLCTEIWFAVYILFFYFYYGTEAPLVTIIEKLLFVRNTGMSHAWYLTAILGFYLLIPFVSKTLKSFEMKTFILPFVIFSVYVFVVPIINVIFRCSGDLAISSLLSTGFSGGCYGLYILLGYFIKKGVFKKIKSFWLILLSMASFIAVVYLQVFDFSKGYQYNLWYDCLFIFICVFGIFELFSRIKRIRAYEIVRFLSYYSFAVYLIHNIILHMIYPYINRLELILPLKVTVLSAAVFVLSMLVAVIIRYIPKVGKFILYAK